MKVIACEKSIVCRVLIHCNWSGFQYKCASRVAYASSEGSGEPLHPSSPFTAFPVGVRHIVSENNVVSRQCDDVIALKQRRIDVKLLKNIVWTSMLRRHSLKQRLIDVNRMVIDVNTTLFQTMCLLGLLLAHLKKIHGPEFRYPVPLD